MGKELYFGIIVLLGAIAYFVGLALAKKERRDRRRAPLFRKGLK